MSTTRPRTAPVRRAWTVALGLLLLLAPAFLPAQQKQQPPPPKQPPSEQQLAETALAAAQQAIEQKNYATAAMILENFLLDHPGYVPALFNLAYAYSLAGRTGEAIEMYRQTLEVDPKLVPAHMNLGLLLLDRNQPAAALEEFQRVLELEPDQYRAHLFAAIALERSGKKDEALAQYQRAAALDPKQHEPREAALALLLEKNDLAGAEKALEELRALEPAEPRLLRLRAELALRQGHTEAALAAYEDYLKAKPDDAEAHLALGRLYRQQGKLEEALQHFQAADPGSGTATATPSLAAASLREQADTLGEMNRWADALPLYQRAAALDANNADLKAALGYAYLATHQYPPAVEALQQALQLDPRRAEAYNHLASALYMSGDLASAIAALDHRAAVAEETPGTLFLRALCYDKLKQCGQAMTYYQKFLAVNTDTQSNAYFEATGRLRLLKNVCREKSQ